MYFVVHFPTVKNRVEKYWLFVVTVIFVIFGSFIIFIALERISYVGSCVTDKGVFKNKSQVTDYEEGKVCECNDSKVICTNVVKDVEVPKIEEFKRSNLKVDSKYLTLGTNDKLSKSALNTRFVSVSTKKDSIDIHIEQEQRCTADGRISAQVGMYYLDKDNLYITNVVSQDSKTYFQQCTVSVTYSISSFKAERERLNIYYVTESGSKEKASLCYYDNKVYIEGDVYSSVDSCNFCKCSDGISKCSNDRFCEK